MSRPPIFLDKTVAGIVNKNDGERVVAGSRRPDGSYRKELKIRPGYTPEEDVKRYRSTRMAEADARAAVKGKVPGLTPGAAPVQAAIAGMSKAQKKNAKRKEKKRDGGEEEVEEEQRGKAKEQVEDVPDAWDDGDEEEAEEAAAPPPPPAAAEPASVVDDEKRIKALRKKLRQAEQLRERGETSAAFTEAEKVKVEGIASLEEEIARLSLGGNKDEKEEA